MLPVLKVGYIDLLSFTAFFLSRLPSCTEFDYVFKILTRFAWVFT